MMETESARIQRRQHDRVYWGDALVRKFQESMGCLVYGAGAAAIVYALMHLR